MLESSSKMKINLSTKDPIRTANKKHHTKDSALRSMVKGIIWRVIGTMDTMILALLVTRRPEVALLLGGTETISKIILYFFHERVWILFTKGDMYNRWHSLAKSITWRLIGTLDTIVLAFLFIEAASDSNTVQTSIGQAATIGILEIFTKSFLYFLHERVWNRVSFGRKKKKKKTEAPPPQ